MGQGFGSGMSMGQGFGSGVSNGSGLWVRGEYRPGFWFRGLRVGMGQTVLLKYCVFLVLRCF